MGVFFHSDFCSEHFVKQSLPANAADNQDVFRLSPEPSLYFPISLCQDFWHRPSLVGSFLSCSIVWSRYNFSFSLQSCWWAPLAELWQSWLWYRKCLLILLAMINDFLVDEKLISSMHALNPVICLGLLQHTFTYIWHHTAMFSVRKTQHLLSLLESVIGGLRGTGYWVPGGESLMGANFPSGLP